MKIKVFVAFSALELEEMVNDWLADKFNKIYVSDKKFSSVTAYRPDDPEKLYPGLSIVIFYSSV